MPLIALMHCIALIALHCDGIVEKHAGRGYNIRTI